MAEHATETLDDREAKPQAARDPRPLIEPLELLEHRPLPVGGNAEPGVPDLDPHLAARAPAADQNAAFQRVFQRIGDEVLQEAAHEAAIGADRKRARREAQFQSLGPGERRELDLQRAHEVSDRHVGDFRPCRPGVEPRNVEKSAENLFDRLEREVDVARQVGAIGASGMGRGLGERTRIEPRGVERLQNVMARRGQEARLG